MSGPDEGMLTAQERAALASLEERAAADDPRLADHLRGLRSKERLLALPKPDLGWLTTTAGQVWRSLRPAVWGPILTIAGLALVVLGLSVSLALSVVGIVIAAVGLGLLVQLITARIERLREEQTRLRAGSSSE
jgi:hypothetical protein